MKSKKQKAKPSIFQIKADFFIFYFCQGYSYILGRALGKYWSGEQCMSTFSKNKQSLI